MTKEELQEIDKCTKSPYYFYKTYLFSNDTRYTEEEFNKLFFELTKNVKQSELQQN